MNKELTSAATEDRFITSDRMVTNILSSIAVGLVIIAIAVGFLGNDVTAIWVISVAAVLDIGAVFLVRQGFSVAGRTLMPLILMGVSGFIAYNRGGLFHVAVLAIPVIVVLSGLLLGVRGLFLFATFGSAIAAFLGYADINGFSPFSSTSRVEYDDIAIAVTLIFLVAFILRVMILRLNQSIQDAKEYGLSQEASNNELKKLQYELQQRVEERTAVSRKRYSQLEAIAEVARSIASVQEEDRLLAEITTLVSESFGYYHVGIFLLDVNREYANLRASNSQGGKRMLARHHRLKVGEQGIVGFVTLRGEPRIALDVGAEAVFFNNPDLPDTHSEVALPLRIGGTVIGALDIQSVDANAFTQDDVEIFSILADQVSVAIQNARSLEQAQRALHEAEVASRQLTGQAWRTYVEKSRINGYRYDGIKPEAVKTLSPDNDKNTLLQPVQLRGQIIGRLKIRTSDADRKWTEDERAILESTAERVAIALESARLLEEAQRRASRESFLSDVAAKLGTSFQLDSILRDTVEVLGKKLSGSIVSFQLSNPSDGFIELNDDNHEK